jgi:hypothetical protein
MVADYTLAKALRDSFLRKQRAVWQDKDICLAIVESHAKNGPKADCMYIPSFSAYQL